MMTVKGTITCSTPKCKNTLVVSLHPGLDNTWYIDVTKSLMDWAGVPKNQRAEVKNNSALSNYFNITWSQALAKEESYCPKCQVRRDKEARRPKTLEERIAALEARGERP